MNVVEENEAQDIQSGVIVSDLVGGNTEPVVENIQSSDLVQTVVVTDSSVVEGFQNGEAIQHVGVEYSEHIVESSETVQHLDGDEMNVAVHEEIEHENIHDIDTVQSVVVGGDTEQVVENIQNIETVQPMVVWNMEEGENISCGETVQLVGAGDMDVGMHEEIVFVVENIQSTETVSSISLN